MTDEMKTIIKAFELFSARRPRPSQVTAGQAAEMLGVHRHTVSKLIEAGTIRLNKCGRIPIEQIDAALQPS